MYFFESIENDSIYRLSIKFELGSIGTKLALGFIRIVFANYSGLKMKKKMGFLVLLISCLVVFLFANNSNSDLPPGINQDQWVQITDNFGIHLENSPVIVSQFNQTQKFSGKLTLNGKYMVKRNGLWYYINNLPKVPSIVPAN